MARVLHVIETLGLGGAERLLALTVRELKRSHTQVVAHLLDAPREWRTQIEDDGVPVESLWLRSSYAAPAAIAGVRQLIRRWRIDLVHSHLYFPNLYSQVAAWCEHVPVVSSLHNLELEPGVLVDNMHLTESKQRALGMFARLGIRLGQPTLVAVSEAVRDSAIRRLGVRPNRVVTIHNAIDPWAFSPAADRAAARAGLGVPPSAVVFAIVGRLVPLKGHRHLFAALRMVRAVAPNTMALVVGDGPGRHDLIGVARAEGVSEAVRFLGAGVGLVETALAAADALVAPSLSEGFGLAVLEAMAMSRACVVSRTGGLPEIVEHEGSGLLIPAGAVEPLAAALIRLAADPALGERFGRRGRTIVESRFDVADTARRLADLYEQVLAGRGPLHAAGSVAPRRLP